MLWAKGRPVKFFLSRSSLLCVLYSSAMHKFKMSVEARKFTVLFNYLFPIRTIKKKMSCPLQTRPQAHFPHQASRTLHRSVWKMSTGRVSTTQEILALVMAEHFYFAKSTHVNDNFFAYFTFLKSIFNFLTSIL